MSHIRPGDHLAVRGAEEVEGRVLHVDRGVLPVKRGWRLGARRHVWAEVGDRFARVPRRSAAGPDSRRQAG